MPIKVVAVLPKGGDAANREGFVNCVEQVGCAPEQLFSSLLQQHRRGQASAPEWLHEATWGCLPLLACLGSAAAVFWMILLHFACTAACCQYLLITIQQSSWTAEFSIPTTFVLQSIS